MLPRRVTGLRGGTKDLGPDQRRRGSSTICVVGLDKALNKARVAGPSSLGVVTLSFGRCALAKRGRVVTGSQRGSCRILAASKRRYIVRKILAVLTLLVAGAVAGDSVLSTAVVNAAPQTIVDQNGEDDLGGQKDLNSLTVDYGLPGATSLSVSWNWDDTATSGANTRDACPLFDTDGDGFANSCVLSDRQQQHDSQHAEALRVHG